MKFLVQALSGMDGSPSTMRLLTSVVVVGVMVVWVVISIQKKEMQPLSLEQVGAVLGALGLKAYQRGKETTPPDGPTNI